MINLDIKNDHITCSNVILSNQEVFRFYRMKCIKRAHLEKPGLLDKFVTILFPEYDVSFTVGYELVVLSRKVFCPQHWVLVSLKESVLGIFVSLRERIERG